MNRMGGLFHTAGSHYEYPAILDLVNITSKTKQPKLYMLIENGIESAAQPMISALTKDELHLTPTQHSIIDPMGKMIDLLMKLGKKAHK